MLPYHMFCVIAVALCCCTSLCVAAAAEASSVPPTVGTGTPAEVSAQGADLTARTEAFVAANNTMAAAISAEEALESVKAAVEEAKKAVAAVMATESTGNAVELVRVLHETLKKKLLPRNRTDGTNQDPTLAEIKDAAARKLVTDAKNNAAGAASSLKTMSDKISAAVKSADVPVEQASTAVKKVSEALKNAGAGGKVLDAVQKVSEIVTSGSTAAVQSQTTLNRVADAMKRMSGSLGSLLSLAEDTLTLAEGGSATDNTDAENTKFTNLTKTAKTVLGDFDAVMSEAVSAADAATAVVTAAVAVLRDATGAAPDAAAAVEAADATRAATQEALTQLKKKLGISGQETLARTPQREHEDAPAVDGSHGSHTSPPDTTDPALLVPNADGGSSTAWVRAPILLLLACVAVW
ncbi:hypothetical protein DQ04_16891000 [Trypanosoma grayi]|uniref:hypothetical protein n=1 Tax=Trypanosoma grayi TaxID=71804 RepID=UPI0004F44FE1|nr:hypothetical protein DQ04_16891000 [Trypanosoma grayi]KEG05972.1 hypothetical protein DQ04_16891000 [Trypanosoma grayi]